VKIRDIWLLSLLVKLMLSALIPINADEAYYWVWSHHLQLSYYDHPAGVAWVFYLGHFLEPFANAVRWPAIIIGHLTLLIWIKILERHLPLENMRWFILLMLFSPFMGAGSLLVTPDIPLMFFWSLSTYFFIRALQENKIRNYVLLGVALGLGACSKYHMVLFLPPAFIYLIAEKRWRDVNLKGLSLTVLAGFIFSLPVLLWNYENNWISLAYQIGHGFVADINKPEWIVRYVVGEILLLFPLVVWAALKAKPPRELRCLIYFAWFPFVFFFLTSLRSFVEANWPIIGFPAVMALAAFYPRMKSWIKYYVGLLATLLVVVICLFFIPALQAKNKHLKVPRESAKLAVELKSYRPLFAQSHISAAMLTYFSKDDIYKLRGCGRIDFYDFISESKPPGDHFYLLTEDNEGLPEWLAKENWQSTVVEKISNQYSLLEFKKNAAATQ
jgi:4-amino-4-deoxy-L-arabinose transferase-like glycosyltransferase